ncbi:hypothetical protein BGX27_001656 [Mortierella sp. AM989]|nr:hypothetical protein BGX27_001656 [Mortierella sp. AM989]
MTTIATHSEPAPQLVKVDNEVDDDVETDPEVDEDYEVNNEIIDHATFDQLLEMDDEEDHEFSKSLVWDYFGQAEQTFEDLNTAMSGLDFSELSRLGHFLKGSSAALGLVKIRESCERLQHYGSRKGPEGIETVPDNEAGELIRALLSQMRQEYDEASSYLKAIYEEQ